MPNEKWDKTARAEAFWGLLSVIAVVGCLISGVRAFFLIDDAAQHNEFIGAGLAMLAAVGAFGVIVLSLLRR